MFSNPNDFILCSNCDSTSTLNSVDHLLNHEGLRASPIMPAFRIRIRKQKVASVRVRDADADAGRAPTRRVHSACITTLLYDPRLGDVAPHSWA